MSTFRGILPELRNYHSNGRQSLLPPRSPHPSMPSSVSDCSAGPLVGGKGMPKLGDGYKAHQRTSSESFLIEEQPSWLDDLLNEPETPVRRGHRRSSSDSFAYSEASSNLSNVDKIGPEKSQYEKLVAISSWGSDNECSRGVRQASLHAEANSSERWTGKSSELSVNAAPYHPSGCSSPLDKSTVQISASPCTTQEFGAPLSASTERHDHEESARDASGSCERWDGSFVRNTSSEMDSKRAKQQFAQRSRVRKLQYIAELERNVQALQVEGSEVAAELEFLDQKNIILSMENKALKQRLESLAQEQLVKYLEHEMLEKEIARLRAMLYQQPPPPPVPHSYQKQYQQSAGHHSRRSSKDLESQLANLSLKHKGSGPSQETVNGPLRI